MGAYLPAKPISGKQKSALTKMLRHETLLQAQYIEQIEMGDRLPGRIETNYDGWERHNWFKKWLELLPESKQSDPFQGTKERRRVPPDPESLTNSIIPHPMLPSDAETLAGALALVNGNIDRDEIDLLLTASQIPDLPLPPNASLVQHKLQLNNAGAYEVDTCCSSFVTMVELASALVRAGIKNKILIVASYIDSLVTDKSSYFSVNTGDAAVAGVVARVEEKEGFVASHSSSHGSRHNGIILEKREPNLLKKTAQSSRYEQEFVTFYNPQATREIARNSQQDMQDLVRGLLQKAQLEISDIDFFVTHQPVHWAANAWREALGIPAEKFYESFSSYGNIACCSAAVNLFEAIEKNLIKCGDRVLLASSGAGENHIATIEKVTPQLIKAVQAETESRSLAGDSTRESILSNKQTAEARLNAQG
ncbi:MAG TPA: 3-oxoacyl-[acyl-carrier-protein] synthase III C-terminal domain-containing protein [Candidatus Melainabacteria bacterium]|nr:3-oxoacyl-[acyl-carrier-protein] synthase III C-terminal domain-containing protein [Candidatus Melainabacteria bacterium]